VRIVYVSSERPSRRREGEEDITASAAASAKAAAKITAVIVSATASTVPKSKSSAAPRRPGGRGPNSNGRGARRGRLGEYRHDALLAQNGMVG
jgi:hypothetical protein